MVGVTRPRDEEVEVDVSGPGGSHIRQGVRKSWTTPEWLVSSPPWESVDVVGPGPLASPRSTSTPDPTPGGTVDSG